MTQSEEMGSPQKKQEKQQKAQLQALPTLIASVVGPKPKTFCSVDNDAEAHVTSVHFCESKSHVAFARLMFRQLLTFAFFAVAGERANCDAAAGRHWRSK